jgi:tetratricopeptide (TPR) repeat protein
VVARDPGSAADRLLLARALTELGEIVAAYRTGDLEAAGAAHLEALTLLETVDGEVDPIGRLRTLVEVRVNLGDVALDLEDPGRALEHYRAAQQAAADLVGRAGTGDETGRRLLVDTLMRVGDADFSRGDLDAARRDYMRVLVTLAEGPGTLGWRRDEGLARYSLGDLERVAGDTATARRQLETALVVQRELVAADSTNGQYQRDLLVTVWRLGDLERDGGRLFEALDRYLEATSIAERLPRGTRPVP